MPLSIVPPPAAGPVRAVAPAGLDLRAAARRRSPVPAATCVVRVRPGICRSPRCGAGLQPRAARALDGAPAMHVIDEPAAAPALAPEALPTLAELISVDDLDIPNPVTADVFLPEAAVRRRGAGSPEAPDRRHSRRARRGALEPAASPFSALDDSLAGMATADTFASESTAAAPSRPAGGRRRV